MIFCRFYYRVKIFDLIFFKSAPTEMKITLGKVVLVPTLAANQNSDLGEHFGDNIFLFSTVSTRAYLEDI